MDRREFEVLSESASQESRRVGFLVVLALVVRSHCCLLYVMLAVLPAQVCERVARCQVASRASEASE